MISTVSISGVDDSVAPSDLVDISQTYPFVEWGINLYPEIAPRPFFPSKEWISELLSYSEQLRLRGILYGRWLDDILDGNPSIKNENQELWNSIKRIQIDISAGHKNIIESLQLIHGKEIILSGLQSCIENSIVHGIHLNAYPLYPKTLTCSGYCGYSVLNGDLNDIWKIGSGDNFWLDVSGFRNKDGITMDLLKVERFLDEAEDYVNNNSLVKALLQTDSIVKRFSQVP